MTKLLANIAIALVFMGLSGFWSLGGFLVGMLAGIAILSLLPPTDQGKTGRKPLRYGIRVWRIVKLAGLFLRELAASALKVAKLALSPRPVMNSGIFAYHLRLESDAEIALLANLITLTPGTLSVDVSADRRLLYIHAIDCPDLEAARTDIRNGFERAILEAFH